MKRLLIVDDEMGSRESLRTVFDRDYHVATADSAKSALKQLLDQRYDVVLLDVMMPDKDGVTLLKETQELYPDIVTHVPNAVVPSRRTATVAA